MDLKAQPSGGYRRPWSFPSSHCTIWQTHTTCSSHPSPVAPGLENFPSVGQGCDRKGTRPDLCLENQLCNTVLRRGGTRPTGKAA